MSNFESNWYNTNDLTLNVMANCARRLDLDLDNNTIADELYEICCVLEDYPEDCGFGSSDHYSYVEQARARIALQSGDGASGSLCRR